MTAILLGQETPGSPEWHELRRGGIGASEIAAVVGLSPYESAFSLWHKKRGNLPESKTTDAMDWGNRLEPVVRDWFAEQHPEFYVQATPGTYADRERQWQRVNPDGFVYNASDFEGDWHPQNVRRIALYEGKTSRFGDGFGPSGSDIIPIGYRCQVQWALDVFDLPRAYVAVLIGGNEPRQYVIEADVEDQRALREAGAAFWESLQNDEEPPIDASIETYEAVRKVHADLSRDTDHEIPTGWWNSLQETRRAIDGHDAAYRLIRSKILAAAGDAHYITVNGERVARRQMSSTGTPYLKEIA